MQTINRQAALVRAKQPFVDWINSISTVEGDASKVDLAQVNDDCNVYLFEEFDHPDDSRSYFEDFKDEIFEAELHCMVVDLEKDRLRREDPFP